MPKTNSQSPATLTDKRAALSAWCTPQPLTAYERHAFARVGAANDNGQKREARRG